MGNLWQQRGHERIRHHIRDPIQIGVVHRIAELPIEAGALRMSPASGIEPHDAPVTVHHLQPPANMNRGSGDDAAALDEGELRGAAANVDVEQAASHFVGDARGARAIGRQHGFHVMARRGADEIAARFGQHGGNRLGVFAAQRLAGENDRAGVDVGGRNGGGSVGVADDALERGIIYARFALIGRQGDRR